MIIIIRRKATREEIIKAKEEFGDFIKIVIDIEKEILAIGGSLHADAEKLLIDAGSNQRDLWGGGFDTATNIIDSQAMINIRPNQGNEGMDILDPKIRKKFLKIAEKLLK